MTSASKDGSSENGISLQKEPGIRMGHEVRSHAGMSNELDADARRVAEGKSVEFSGVR